MYNYVVVNMLGILMCVTVNTRNIYEMLFCCEKLANKAQDTL